MVLFVSKVIISFITGVSVSKFVVSLVGPQCVLKIHFTGFVLSVFNGLNFESRHSLCTYKYLIVCLTVDLLRTREYFTQNNIFCFLVLLYFRVYFWNLMWKILFFTHLNFIEFNWDVDAFYLYKHFYTRYFIRFLQQVYFFTVDNPVPEVHLMVYSNFVVNVQ